MFYNKDYQILEQFAERGYDVFVHGDIHNLAGPGHFVDPAFSRETGLKKLPTSVILQYEYSKCSDLCMYTQSFQQVDKFESTAED